MDNENVEAKIACDFIGGRGFLSLQADNEWVRAAKVIPWARIEETCGDEFARLSGASSSLLRTALCAYLLMTRYGYSDHDFIEQVKMNVYFQYFIGMESFSSTLELDADRLNILRKAVTPDMMERIHQAILESNSVRHKM